MLSESGQADFQPSPFLTSDDYSLYIPALNLVNVQVSFADPYNAKSALDVLKNGLGHYLAPPGSGQKMVLFGHSSGYNWDSSQYKQILREINALVEGDELFINYHGVGYRYRVNKHEIIPQNELVKVMEPTQHEELVLYTCWPPNKISHRYLIYASAVKWLMRPSQPLHRSLICSDWLKTLL
ncbi:sortase [Candidatus Peregrinibacteria bacterium]|nr:MAG: sortase [Candidatus Peregrinibacteria bacterium]